MPAFLLQTCYINIRYRDFLAQKIQKEEKSAMRNLKKILALALALVMSMSLMATANAFTDDDSITDTYETAVTVLSGLKVFQGYDDGSFLPQGAITRAEVAAIIYRIVTGDVEDTQQGIYADYNKFDDVASTSWYAGYVNFCANAEYIKGYDAKHFGPNDRVTGYQALAMILRALGYDKNDEFTGSTWQVQTAAVGEQRGITDNITAGTLGGYATREVVAEILFQAIMVETVNYTPAFGYQIGDTSIGYKTFGLENVVGVVTANEYADLEDATPMAEGKTRLDVDGEDYTIAYSTDLTNMGMAYNVYLANGGKVLAIADAGNTVFETGEGTAINKSNTGMTVSDAQKFLNFDEDVVYTSDWRIEYVLVFDATTTMTAAEVAAEFDANYKANGGTGKISYKNGEDSVSVVFSKNSKISAYDLAQIEGIFSIGDRYDDNDDTDIVEGEVYVGTQSNKDISDEITYRQFRNDYIDTEDNDANYDESDNGEWLKVIDNDSDGVADYIFLTEFAMSLITDISKKAVYTFEALDGDEPAFEAVKVDEGDIKTEDELAEGDVVIYTLIDGTYYVDIAEMVTETVDKGGVDKRNETITCDGAEYGQSYIGYAEIMDYDITKAVTGETYDLYLDHFNYVRLYQESTYNRGFVLLTDGYYYTNGRTDEFQATIYDLDAEELVDVDVDAGSKSTDASNFIDTDEDGDNGNRGTWKRLLEAGQVYFGDTETTDPFITNVAASSVADDVYTLTKVENASNRVDYYAQELDVTTRTSLSARTLNGDIQTTTGTVYYLVVKDGSRILDVITWTGYANTPDDAAFGDSVVGYAVTHDITKDYAVADVVVFETTEYDPYALHFVYEGNSWDEAITIGYDETEETYVAEMEVEVDDDAPMSLVDFYYIYNSGDVDLIEDDGFAEANIYAGYADVVRGVDFRDYVLMRADADRAAKKGNTSDEEISFRVDEAPAFVLGIDGKGYYFAEEQSEDFENGDMLIVVTDSKYNVQYVINVSQSLHDYDGDDKLEADEIVAALEELYDEIWDAYEYVEDIAVTFYDKSATAGQTTTVTYAEAMAAKVDFDVDGDVKKVVLYEDDVKIDVDDVAVKTDGVTYKLVVTDVNDDVYTYELKQNGWVNNAALLEDGTEVTTRTSNYDGGTVTLNGLIGENGEGGYYTYTGAKWVWTFYDNNGMKVVDTDNVSTISLSYATCVVTSEDGTPHEYIIYFNKSATADVAASAYYALGYDAAEAWKAWVEDFTGTNASHYATIATAMKDAGYESADIVTGFIDSHIDDDTLLDGNNADITGEDGIYTIAIDDGTIKADNLVAVMAAAGYNYTTAQFSWTLLANGDSASGNWTDWSNQWDNMKASIQAGNTFDVEITCGDLTLNVTLEK